MAVSGALLLLFLLVHLIGNLQVFGAPEAINSYAHLLHSMPALVIGARIMMLLLFAVHIITSIQLTLENRAARPVSYHKEDTVAATLASRTMIWTGLLVGAFLVIHLLHLTGHQIGPELQMVNGEPDLHSNIVASFKNPLFAGFYMVCMIAIYFHLVHAFQSAFQTFGLSHKKCMPVIKTIGIIYAAIIGAGNFLIPLSILLGFVK